MNIIIFDFDDTLFATTHMIRKIKESIECKNAEEFVLKMESLSTSIINLIKMAKKYGKVYIVTNAEKEWIDLCIKRHLPGCEILLDLLDGLISARDEILTTDLVETEWKKVIFMKNFGNIFQDGKMHHLLSFGDRLGDRNAALNMKMSYPNIIVKSILFETEPSLEHLLMQHELVLSYFDNLQKHEDDLDLILDISKVN
jgi:hypothetical protein